MSDFQKVKEWLREDRECRVCEIHITALDPEWPDEDETGRPNTAEDAIWSEGFEVKLSEALYGETTKLGDLLSMTTWTHHGFSETSLDDACAKALAMVEERDVAERGLT